MHCLHWEKQSGNCGYSPFSCLCTVFTEKKSQETAVILRLAVCALSSLRKSQKTAVILRLAVCALSSLRKPVRKLRLFSFWLSVHCLHWEKQSGKCGYSPFGCLCTAFTEKTSQETAVILRLAVCALSSLRKTVRKMRLFSIWLPVHYLYWEKQSGNCCYSPFGSLCTVFAEKNLKEAEVNPFDCLFTVFTEKNRQETAPSSQLAVRARSWRRTVYMKQHSRFILLCVWYRLDKEIFWLASSSSFRYHT